MTAILLRYNPFNIFRGKISPVSLYARKKWLGEAGETVFENDFNKTLRKLTESCFRDDSDLLEKIEILFSLHLTKRETTSEIDNTIDSLISESDILFETHDKSVVKTEYLKNLPFAESRGFQFYPCAALFLASVFGKASEEKTEVLYRKLISCINSNRMEDLSISFLHNFFRALVVNPEYAEEEITITILKHFFNKQNSYGHWGVKIPFYQMLNAVAHLDLPEADIQLEKGFKRLVKLQNPDGSWGIGQDKEWKTFLSVHALKNRSLL